MGKKQFLNYGGLYGEDRRSFSADFIHCEAIRKRSELYNFEITEHLHTDLIQLFIIYTGGGLLLSESRKIALTSPCALLIPNNVLHGFVYPSDVSGMVITLSRAFYDRCVEEGEWFFKADELQQIGLDGESDLLQSVKILIGLIEQEIAAEKARKSAVLKLLFQLLLLKILREATDYSHRIIPTDNRVLHYYDNLRRLIRKHMHESMSVQDYARLLGISSVHLNRICQSLVQKSALQVVHEQVLQEAKKYLEGTDKTIREIAYFLDFTDSSHFSKFFKRMTDMTPSAYRKSLSVNDET